MSSTKDFTSDIFSWQTWKRWCFEFYGNFYEWNFDGPLDPNGESPAFEVFEYDDPDGYFAGMIDHNSD